MSQVLGAILVVDDNEMNRDMLSRRLIRQGHTVKTADNGRQAMDMLRLERFDLVLLDIMMPEMNGYEVLEQIKSDMQLRHVPVIMISAVDEIESVVRCIELGAEDYLPKPFNPTLLKARIGAVLEKKRLRDQEQAYIYQIEAEKRRADDLLHVILPDTIVDELKTTQSVRPRRYDHVAVLFGDVVNFTTYCDRRAPEEVITHLQEMVDAFERLALKYNLEKIKTVGDAFMATAGLLKPVDNPVLNCVACGLEMTAITPRLSAGWEIRVGIHVGPVVAGVVGHRQYLFDIWGDTVNTAARLQTLAPVGGVYLSASAWDAVKLDCIGESRGIEQVKGKGEAEMFLVNRIRPEAHPIINPEAALIAP